MRELTGNWYLKRRFFGGYKVMVELVNNSVCEYDLIPDPNFFIWKKATGRDLIELDIKCI